MQAPVIIIIGRPQVGKTTTRGFVTQLTGLRGGSCSDVVYHFLASSRGQSVEYLKQLPKESIRPDLMVTGDFLCGLGEFKLVDAKIPTENNSPDDLLRVPSTLIRTLYMSGCNVIDGVRRRLELQEARDRLLWNGIRNAVFWVENPRVPNILDNTEVTSADADDIILNDGTLEQLKERTAVALQKAFPIATQAVPPPPVLTAEQVKDLTGGDVTKTG